MRSILTFRNRLHAFDFFKELTQKVYNILGQRMRRLYKVPELQTDRAFIYGYGILNWLVIDRVAPVQKWTEDKDRALSTRNESLTQTTAAPSPISEDTNKGENDGEFEEYLVSHIFRNLQRT